MRKFTVASVFTNFCIETELLNFPLEALTIYWKISNDKENLKKLGQKQGEDSFNC